MTLFILYALLNGFCISLSRVLIGRLSHEVGAFKASWWSYITGFIFVASIIFLGGFSLSFSGQIPTFAYFGGVFGAVYVVINSYVFTQLGAVKTVLLIVSGQMLTGILLDHHGGSPLSLFAQLLGMGLIVLGIYLAKTSNSRQIETSKRQ